MGRGAFTARGGAAKASGMAGRHRRQDRGVVSPDPPVLTARRFDRLSSPGDTARGEGGLPLLGRPAFRPGTGDRGRLVVPRPFESRFASSVAGLRSTRPSAGDTPGRLVEDR